ncbi:hypothetical protein N0V90_005417 [Kalmusia sp. IMI 367209]|nr:hypothetical protein N0V90_005417 [Kalmusia sp. IMI 367209]
MFCVWYLAAIFHLAPKILTPPDKQRLHDIYIYSKLAEIWDKEYVLLTASTPTGTLNLKFLTQPLGYSWLSLMYSKDADALPASWMVFVTLDKVHHALEYSYLGRLWGQHDGGALGKRVLQYSMLVHLVSGLLVDVGALVIRNFFDATYLGENWRDSTSTMIIGTHLITALAEMMSVEERVTITGIARLIEKVHRALVRLGLVAPRETKKTPPTPSPTHEKKIEDDQAQVNLDPVANEDVPKEEPAVPQ